MFTSLSLAAQVALFSTFLAFLQSCGVKTPPTPLLPADKSALDVEAKKRKMEQEKKSKQGSEEGA